MDINVLHPKIMVPSKMKSNPSFLKPTSVMPKSIQTSRKPSLIKISDPNLAQKKTPELKKNLSG